MKFFSNMKNSLSHVKRTSWHYRMVKEVWGKRADRGKACTYYWIKIPTSAVGVVIMYVLVTILYTIVTVGGWFIGFIPTYFKTEDPYLRGYLLNQREEPSFYPYRYTSKGKRRRVVPWQIASVIGVIALLYYLAIQNQNAGLQVGLTLGSVIGMGVLVVGVVWIIVTLWGNKIVTKARNGLGNYWGRLCPPLTVVEQADPEPSYPD